MSFFSKFWKKGKKGKPKVDFPDGGFTAELPSEEGGGEAVQERSRRSKRQLSISRSGRYKANKRERGAIPFQDSDQNQGHDSESHHHDHKSHHHPGHQNECYHDLHHHSHHHDSQGHHHGNQGHYHGNQGHHYVHGKEHSKSSSHSGATCREVEQPVPGLGAGHCNSQYPSVPAV